MPDVFTKSKRSQVMARIRSKGNKDTEVVLARLLRLHGITGWRRHQPVFGRPDFIFRTLMLAVFVDGCFWHGCPHCYQAPASNRKFWSAKYQSNKARDRHVGRKLRKGGWRVLRIWEHQLSKPNAVMARLRKAIAS